MIEKSFKLSLKAIEEKDSFGYFEGYAAIFGEKDLVGDIIRRGAFKKTLDSWKNSRKNIPLLYQHEDTIGVITEAYEDDVGLYVKGEINLNVEEGRKAYELLKQGALQGLSFGYEVLQSRWNRDGTREILEVKLWEISLVTFPAQEKTKILSFKKVVPFQDLPLADEDIAWDADEARWRVARWASSDGSGEKDKMDWAKYRKAFLWYDEETPENFGAYKLPIATVIDGQLKAVPRAIYAAGAVLMGARGGVDIPEAEKEMIKRHLEKYYDKLGREAPWNQERQYELDLLLVTGILDNMKLEVKEGRVLNKRNRELLENIKNALEALLKLTEPQASTQELEKPQDETNYDALLEEMLRNLQEIQSSLSKGG